MRARDDGGAELNAEFTVEAAGPGLCLVLESAGGRGRDGGRSRNDQYVPALTLLLRRLRERRAVLRSALVDSARASRLPENERTVLRGPVELAAVTDIGRLRLDLTTAQGRVGLPAGAVKEGNNRKRLRLRLDVPGYGPGDAARLAADLSAPLAGDLVLAQIGEASGDPSFAVLDGLASVKVRREQAQLRTVLAGDRDVAACALCGHEFPMGFLVAAHIKKRSLCSDDERRDLRHVAMLACTFGCDALYESGWITVDASGCVRTIGLDGLPEGRAREHLRRLAGQRCPAHDHASEGYFAWHRATVFRG
jgi:hypothetical protein